MPICVFRYTKDTTYISTSDGPTNKKFSYQITDIPVLFVVPTILERMVYEREYSSLIRTYFKHIRTTAGILHTDVLIHSSGICVTFGELSIIYIKNTYKKKEILSLKEST